MAQRDSAPISYSYMVKPNKKVKSNKEAFELLSIEQAFSTANRMLQDTMYRPTIIECRLSEDRDTIVSTREVNLKITAEGL